APGPPNILPRYVRAEVHAFPNGGYFEDYWQDRNFDGAPEPYSSRIVFRILNAIKVEICTITYDLSDATSAAGVWSTTGNTPIVGAFDLNLRDGRSTCGMVDQSQGSGLPVDLRDVFETRNWGLGFGEIDDVEPMLKQ